MLNKRWIKYEKNFPKKLINFFLKFLFLILIIPFIGIVSLSFKENTSIKKSINNNQFIDSSYINEKSYTLSLNNALGIDRTIGVGTSNVYKSIPQGYIIVSSDSYNKNQELICLDKNDPTKKLWQLNLSKTNTNTNVNIYGIEYTPYDGGRLVVLYSEDSNDNEYNYKDKSKQVKFKVFKIINDNPKLDFAGFGWRYRNGLDENDAGGRLDTWAISPILNFEGVVTKYLFYCKEQYFTNNDSNARTRFFLIDIKNPNQSQNKCQAIKMRWEGAKYNSGEYTDNNKVILSLASFEKNNDFYTIPLIIDFIDRKLELGIYKSANNDGLEFNPINFITSQDENNQHIEFDQNIDPEIFDSKDNSLLFEKAANLVKNSISSSTFQKKDNKLKIVFALNMNPNGTDNPHYGSKFIVVEIDDKTNIVTNVKQLFNNNSSNDESRYQDELWHGYFANEVIIKHGINVTQNNDYLTPFIGLGWLRELNNHKWFVHVVKNIFDDISYINTSNNDVFSNDFRMYRVNGGSNSINGIYSSDNIVSYNQFGFEQFNVGFPILEYSDDYIDNVFNRNILFAWNKQEKAIVINQKDRDGKVLSENSTYGYYTRFEKNKFVYSDLDLIKNIDKVNKEDIESLKDKVIEKLNGKNIITNSIKQITNIVFDYDLKNISFDLELSEYFDSKGILQKNGFFNFEISGFEKTNYKTILLWVGLGASSISTLAISVFIWTFLKRKILR